MQSNRRRFIRNMEVAWTLVLLVNFANAEAIVNNARDIGTGGQIECTENNLLITKNKLPVAPGFGGYVSFNRFAASEQKVFAEKYNQ